MDSWAIAATSFATGATLAYLLLERRMRTRMDGRVNRLVQLELEKVVNTCTISEIEEAGKKVMCRCWKSKKFPYCDGAHVAHNKETGDNVGPLIIQK